MCNYQKCLICGENDATKKNSHIIPSFLVAMTCSYDHSYKRGKELMFTISNRSVNVYTGELPDTKLEEVFKKEELTDERIREELSKNRAAKDYVFCPTCESKLGTLLEGPYREFLMGKRRASSLVPTLFWISVIWRMSITNDYGFRLSKERESVLHEILKRYLATNGQIEQIKFPFRYKMLYCKNFGKNNGSVIYATSEGNIVSMLLGDIAVCFFWDMENLPSDYSFYSLEKEFNDAPINEGKDVEKHKDICKGRMKEVISGFFVEMAKLKILDEQHIVLQFLWHKLGRKGNMPEWLIRLFLLELFDESVKIGERHTMQRYVELFNKYCKIYDNYTI